MAVWKTLGTIWEGIRLDNRINSSRHCIVWHCELFPDGLTPHEDQTRPPSQGLSHWPRCSGMLTKRQLGETPSNDEGFEAWRRDMAAGVQHSITGIPSCGWKFLAFIFVRAHREQDFPLYVETLKALVPGSFALDHQNYASGSPVHIRDMEGLPPAVQHQFEVNGNWGVSKKSQEVSTIPLDQAHEQNPKSL
ncbi:hypothetical protein GWK47_011729 [Chionoecetes opilio]|uniref:Uncharacterized protein n=1 Tax=Chionoecetes opilio TaxID=41210 RepID=A0A8J5CMD9_CHIOP|nr:hypothetical protein GWK47_011729 [Chionoecetes opilio]